MSKQAVAWRPLAEVAVVSAGGTPGRASARMFGGSIPWVKSGELAAGEIFETEECLTEEGLASCAAKRIRPGASLIAMYGATAGAASRLRVQASTNQAIAAVEPVDERDDDYVFALLEWVASSLSRQTQGSGQPNLNKGMIERARCFWPSEALHRYRIGRVNELLGKAIREVQGQAAAKRRLKRALMQRLLASHADRPAGFQVMKAGEAFSERDERGMRDLPLLSVTGGRGVVARDDLERRDTSSEDKSAYKRIVPGDIVYNTMRMWQGVCGLVVREGIVSPAYTVLVPEHGVSSRYCAHLFKQPRMISLFRRYSQGLVDDTLNLKYSQFSRIQLALPKPSDQERAASLLDGLDADIGTTEDLLAALRLQKRGVMQKLLSGELW